MHSKNLAQRLALHKCAFPGRSSARGSDSRVFGFAPDLPPKETPSLPAGTGPSSSFQLCCTPSPAQSRHLRARVQLKQTGHKQDFDVARSRGLQLL